MYTHVSNGYLQLHLIQPLSSFFTEDWRYCQTNTNKKSKRTTRTWTRRFDAWRESRRNKYSAPWSTNRNLNTVLKHFYAEVVMQGKRQWTWTGLPESNAGFFGQTLEETWDSQVRPGVGGKPQDTEWSMCIILSWWYIIIFTCFTHLSQDLPPHSRDAVHLNSVG